MRKSVPARLLALVVLISSAASAASVTITTGSTYSPTAAVSTYSAPNATWTLTFQVANPPTVLSTGSGTFTTTYTNGVFTLNGTPITLTGSNVIFQSDGGFEILLDPATALRQNDEEGAEFSGSTSSPTIVPGTYPFTVFQLFQFPSGTPIVLTLISSNVVITANASSPGPTPTPIPPSTLLALTGLAGLGIYQFLKRKFVIAPGV